MTSSWGNITCVRISWIISNTIALNKVMARWKIRTDSAWFNTCKIDKNELMWGTHHYSYTGLAMLTDRRVGILECDNNKLECWIMRGVRLCYCCCFTHFLWDIFINTNINIYCEQDANYTFHLQKLLNHRFFMTKFIRKKHYMLKCFYSRPNYRGGHRMHNWCCIIQR